MQGQSASKVTEGRRARQAARPTLAEDKEELACPEPYYERV